MAIWEMMVECINEAHSRGREWLSSGEIIRETRARHADINSGTISAQLRFHCINDPSKKNSPSLQYRSNPLFVSDDPTMHGKRYRLLSQTERQAFLSNPRDDLETVSYAQLLDWLGAPKETVLEPQVSELEAEVVESEAAEIGGPALLEIHLQDYILRNWRSIFPDLQLYQGTQGREFATYDPSVGILDFLATDRDGNFVVIETKRNQPDRQVIGQILGYMGWVQEKLAGDQKTVHGILITNETSDRLRLGLQLVPNVRLMLYEISFQLRDAD